MIIFCYVGDHEKVDFSVDLFSRWLTLHQKWKSYKPKKKNSKVAYRVTESSEVPVRTKAYSRGSKQKVFEGKAHAPVKNEKPGQKTRISYACK